MRRNNFTSASDRRWQRRYERIQQRKEDEAIRRERVEYESEMEKYEDIFRQLEDERLRRHLEEEQRRMRQMIEERERQIRDFEQWLSRHYIIIDDVLTGSAPEPDLEEGDSSTLDVFLDEFLAPEA